MNTRYYTKTVDIPDTVDIEKGRFFYKFSGALGHTYLQTCKIDPTGKAAIFYKTGQKQLQLSSPSKPLFGTLHALVLHKMRGVSQGYLLYLKVTGIGYRVSINHNHLLLKCGKSHDLIYTIPSAIRIFLLDPTVICLFGVDKNQLSQVAAKIRNCRAPGPYKDKGIRFLNEKNSYKAIKKR